MMTFRTLNNYRPDHAKALRFGLYYRKDSKTAARILEVKQRLSEEFGQECSYSVMFALMIDFYLQNRDKVEIKRTDKPELI